MSRCHANPSPTQKNSYSNQQKLRKCAQKNTAWNRKKIQKVLSPSISIETDQSIPFPYFPIPDHKKDHKLFTSRQPFLHQPEISKHSNTLNRTSASRKPARPQANRRHQILAPRAPAKARVSEHQRPAVRRRSTQEACWGSCADGARVGVERGGGGAGWEREGVW